jgi:hypothetical protein
MRTRFALAVCVALALLVSPQRAGAWGANGQKLIANKAIETLPPELQAFFETNRNAIVQHVTEPLDWRSKNPVSEAYNQQIFLDRYGRFPFDALPRDFKAAQRKHGVRTIATNGVLPWQIGVYSLKLTNAFKARNWDEVREIAGVLAFYVAQAHDPFSTTENFDGRLTNQQGLDQRFGNSLVDRFSLFLFIRPNDAFHIADPTDHAFETCLNAHSWLSQLLLADRRARRGLPDYTDDYYDRLYSQAGAILVRQISDAATNVGSFWLTSWINAGRPPLPGR